MKKRLIITADDFGITEGVNSGIIDCYKKSTITDISLLAVGESFEHAVKLAKENNIKKIGIHLSLTGPFKPASMKEEVSTVLNRDKTFLKSHISFFLKYFSKTIKPIEIKTEFKNQILKIKNEGFKITHIDSHEHIHMMPGILKIVINLALENKINYIRFPLEKLSILNKLRNPRTWLRNILLSSVCKMSKNLIDSAGLKRNNSFIGHSFAHNVKEEELIKAIANIKDDLVELGVHPGYSKEEIEKKHPQHKTCEKELNILCSKNVGDKIKALNIELVSC